MLLNEYEIEFMFRKIRNIRNLANVHIRGPHNTAEKRLRMRGAQKDGEEFKCQIVNKNMAF